MNDQYINAYLAAHTAELLAEAAQERQARSIRGARSGRRQALRRLLARPTGTARGAEAVLTGPEALRS